ncbi:Major facilitator superfamily domain, general substrate transporter [Niveomyces insectorum RCEF 264]|uniref:Major facilitator superfamily domain, general substrate transporter n=1 Tax=Niveomyces insectorum RCEF 264 TaxID=1081102 RepID=A0A167THB9_9HYPO|nr:Major facilitator superfamily domain, general substrate transporter [Niveomyces insectorum RCEF 264]
MADPKAEDHVVAVQLENTAKENGDPLVDPMEAEFQDISSRDEAWKAAQTKKLLRKVDLRLLPLLILMYLLNSLDRSNLAQAALGTLQKDLGMTGIDYNVATSILFVGYLLMQLPSNLLLTRIRPAMYLGSVMVAWGAVSAAQAGIQSYGGLLACRFVLGVVEAPFFPGAIMLMSSWYTRAELTPRIAIYYAGNALANMFGGLLSAGVLGNLEGAHGIAGWRWLFIIEGSLTIGVAAVAALVLPNYPSQARGFSEEEKRFAQWRLLNDAKEDDYTGAVTLREGLRLAFSDYRIFLFAPLLHLSLLTQTFTYFFPTIVNTLGYSKIITLLLTVPVWFATFLVSLVITAFSGRIGQRSLFIIALLLLSAVGNIIMITTHSVGPRFFAMFLLPMGTIPAYQLMVAWVANSFPRPLVKRSVAIAFCNIIGNVATIYGPYMYPATSGPQYIPGGAAVAGVCVLGAALAYALRRVHIHENKKLEARENFEAEVTYVDGNTRRRGFRYVI